MRSKGTAYELEHRRRLAVQRVLEGETQAAVAASGYGDWIDFYSEQEYRHLKLLDYEFGPLTPATEALYRRSSPYFSIQAIQTPLMLVLGEADYRTPPGAGGEQMFRALKFLKKPVIMVRFPGESHELSRSGQPWHRIERLEHIVGWFDKYLQGIHKPEYDETSGGEVSIKSDDLGDGDYQ